MAMSWKFRLGPVGLKPSASPNHNVIARCIVTLLAVLVSYTVLMDHHRKVQIVDE